MRSLLTILGVAIGTAMIIVTISLGNGAEQAQLAVLESNSNLQIINVSPYYSYNTGGAAQSGDTRRITRVRYFITSSCLLLISLSSSSESS